jgi:hypothetical protein
MIRPDLWTTKNGPKSGLFFEGSKWQKIGPDPKSRESRSPKVVKVVTKKIRPTKVVSLIVVW